MYWSAKDKFSALKYEVAVTLRNPRIIWVSGPFKGSISDISIARERNGFIASMRNNEVSLADKGYVGADKLWYPAKEPCTPEQRRSNYKLARLRQVIERANQRIKIFKSMAGTWRHDFEFNGKCFHVVCKITNIIFEAEPLNKNG